MANLGNRKLLFLGLLAFAVIIILLVSTVIHPPDSGTASRNNSIVQNNSQPQEPKMPPGCGPLKVYIINVSQADAILLITPQNKTVLIDAGSARKPHSAANTIAFLRKQNISCLDHLIASHYHEDHIGGMEQLFNNFQVGTIYDNGNCGGYKSVVQRELQAYEKNYSYVAVKGDMDILLDSCLSQSRLIVAYDRPEGCWPSGSDTSNENENSVMLRIVYGNTSFFFGADCENNCEQTLVDEGKYIHSDFLKVDHHGSATSSTAPFLSAVGARYFAISTDKVRSVTDGYYHPRQLALANLYAAGARGNTLFRTDLNGDILAISDGRSISVSSTSTASECALFSGYSSSDLASYGPIAALASSCN